MLLPVPPFILRVLSIAICARLSKLFPNYLKEKMITQALIIQEKQNYFPLIFTISKMKVRFNRNHLIQTVSFTTPQSQLIFKQVKDNVETKRYLLTGVYMFILLRDVFQTRSNIYDGTILRFAVHYSSKNASEQMFGRMLNTLFTLFPGCTWEYTDQSTSVFFNQFQASIIFLYPLKRQKIRGFLSFSGGIEMDCEPKIG